MNLGSPPSASPTAIVLPAWCAPMTKPKTETIKLLVGTRLVTDRRFRGARLSDRPRGLWPALPASHRRQSQGQERRMPSDLRANTQRQRRPDVDRVAAADAFSNSAHSRESGNSATGSPPTRGRAENKYLHRTPLRHGPHRARAHASSPACIITAATSRAGSVYWPNSASAWERRSSPSMTFSITRRSAGRSLDVLTCVREKCTHDRGGFAARRQCRTAS